MAFNSRQCVSCNEVTKRDAGRYYGEDEQGRYSGPMYICDNPNCNISYERKKLIKASAALKETNKQLRVK